MSIDVSLTLNEEERELVLEILEEHHRRLLREISRADHHDFKVVLQKKEKVVDELLGRLTVCS